jgi:hypothetical protein
MPTSFVTRSAALGLFLLGLASVGSVAAADDQNGKRSILKLPTSAVPPKPAMRAGPVATPLPTSQPPKTEPPILHARPGPWGELDYFTVYLEASIATLKSMEIPSFDTTWNFVGYSEDQVAKLFESAKLPPAILAELLDRKKWRREEKTITVLPSRDAVLGLPQEARTAIYQVLARWEENPFHFEPEVVAGRDVREWLQRANLAEDILATIEKTVYLRGKNLVFADTPLLLRMVPGEDERLKIRKALSRTPTLVVKLRLDPTADIDKIAEYWGGYTKSKDVAPFLESISNNPVIHVIDIIHLLPTGVRRLLYTYPGQNHGRSGYYPDCHWTSLNFANFEPLARLADPPMATAYTLENYTRITGEPYRYGDVLFLMDGNTGNAVHSCVYIADDIVYTKNGRSPTQPWVLMKLDDVVSFYGMFYQPQVACYRRKAE